MVADSAASIVRIPALWIFIVWTNSYVYHFEGKLESNFLENLDYNISLKNEGFMTQMSSLIANLLFLAGDI